MEKKAIFGLLRSKRAGRLRGRLGYKNPEFLPGALNMQSESKKLLSPKTFLFYENPRVNKWNLGPIFFTNFGAKIFF